MKKLIHKAYRKLYRFSHRIAYTRSVLNQMRAASDRRVYMLADVIEAALHQRMTASEKEYVSNIESVRASLLDSNEVIPTGSRPVQTEGTESVAQICRDGSKKKCWGLFLMKLVRAIQPSICLELGSCVGISTAYQASALSLNGKGRLISIEGSTSRAVKARETLRNLGLDNAEVINGEFDDVLPCALDRARHVDVAFIDGDHHFESTVQNVARVRSHMPDGAILVVDDISWSEGMIKAWNEIRQHRRVDIALDLYTVGLCWLGDSGQTVSYKLALW